MNATLLLLAGWLSAALAPLDPKDPKGQVPTQEAPKLEKVPTQDVPQVQPLPAAKLPAITRPARASLRPGAYALESLKLPEILKMEAFDAWPQGAAWPQVDRAVVVVTTHADDPQRFMAFLVDLNNQRIAAIRDGDIARHLHGIGEVQTVGKPGKPAYDGSAPATTPMLAGSGAVIILAPPRPPGPRGIPDDFTAKLLDVATMMGAASTHMATAQAALK